MRKPSVVDTNVPIVANQKGGEPLACAAACADALYKIVKRGILVLDESGLIFEEYKSHLSFAGQPGAGDFFFKWLVDNRYRSDRVTNLALAEDPLRPGEFEAFPDDGDLSSFDRSDRKFVAAALAHPGNPPVLNATDSDWWNFRSALRRHNLNIEFVCGENRFHA